ncbi:hypothetical protein Aoc01nite_79910 [Actinoplanes octamycinicus]|nr:hypothetical protein Aoc01nite_79910 [Actinoplanes octamycinicus]
MRVLREAFGPDASPSPEARQRARAALAGRIGGRRRAGRRFSFRIPIAVGMAGAATVAVAFAVAHRTVAPVTPPVALPSTARQEPGGGGMPYLRPVSAAQYLENAAWTAERQQWTDPAPDQFMYVETRELRNPAGYENENPNGSLLPGRAKYRTIQEWNRLDGEVWAKTRNTGRIEVLEKGKNGMSWGRIDWSRLTGLTTPEKIQAFYDDPGPTSMDPEALVGQYVLPPKVEAAFFRYLAQQPGMKVNNDAVNIDGRPAIGMGRIEEGYLSRELLFDKQTYRLIGDRLIAVADEREGHDDGFPATRKGDVLRQVIYTRQVIVDRLFDTR